MKPEHSSFENVLPDSAVLDPSTQVKDRHPWISILVFILILLSAAAWIIFNVHPDSSVRKNPQAKGTTNLSSRSESILNNLKSEALSDIVYIRKIYKIPEGSSAGQCPLRRNH